MASVIRKTGRKIRLTSCAGDAKSCLIGRSVGLLVFRPFHLSYIW